MNIIYTKPKLKSLVFSLCFLIFSTSGSLASNFELYSDENGSSQLQTTQEISEENNEGASFSLYEQDNQLKAPPGGGEPIGGVPVGDGYLLLSLIGISYTFYHVLKNKRKLSN